MKLSEHLKKFTNQQHKRMSKHLSSLERAFGINYFNYYSVSPEGGWSLVTSNPEIGEFYDSQSSFLVDPLLRHPDNYFEGVILWSSLNQQCQDQLVKPLQERFDMGSGLTLAFIDPQLPGRVRAVGFTAPLKHTTFMNVCMNELESLKEFSQFFMNEEDRLIQSLHENPVHLSRLKGDAFFEYKPFQLQQNCGRRILTQSEAHGRVGLRCQSVTMKDSLLQKLSIRERQCVSLVLHGKTAQATGQILALSRRTVEHYLESARSKLGCRRKSDLFEKFNGSLFNVEKVPYVSSNKKRPEKFK